MPLAVVLVSLALALAANLCSNQEKSEPEVEILVQGTNTTPQGALKLLTYRIEKEQLKTPVRFGRDKFHTFRTRFVIIGTEPLTD